MATALNSCNSLPSDIRHENTLDIFKSNLNPIFLPSISLNSNPTIFRVICSGCSPPLSLLLIVLLQNCILFNGHVCVCFLLYYNGIIYYLIGMYVFAFYCIIMVLYYVRRLDLHFDLHYINTSLLHGRGGAGIAQWLEHRTRD